ncbi:MAG: asparaginase domain-containing protein [Oscillospiraceae bacterium]
MKLLFVFTGGTIGSTVGDKFIGIDNKKPQILLTEYDKHFGIDFDYDVITPYFELSENNTGENIKLLVNSVKSNSDKYDGIVVAHGTDTLQYTSAALGYCLGNDSIPVCIISSNYPIEDSRANGLDNLRGAVRFISENRGRGVWTVYKNVNEDITVHRATRLLQGMAFTDAVYSVKNQFYGYYDNNFIFHKNAAFSERKDEISIFDANSLTEQSNSIVCIKPYVGVKYPELNKDIKYIIHESFHSGTINTKSEFVTDFFNKAERLGIKCFITGVTDNKSYESTKYFKELCIMPVYNISPISVYMKLWLADSCGLNVSEVLNKSLGGDILL